jgi:predicted O-methyltransferase YrrM
MPEGVDMAVAENQRLNKEVKELRARIAALESSRWWRLHPRFALLRLLRRLMPARPATERRARPVASEPAPTPVDELTARFREEVVARGSFSQDWFTMHIQRWEPFVRELEGTSARILELGSFEGLSAAFLLWRLPDAHVTCVDTFAGIPEYAAYGIAGPELGAAFDRNVALVDGSRVRKLTGETHRVLPDLVDEQAEFDLVYVDASHRALDVLVDAALMWKLLAPNGIAIFDDYDEVSALPNPNEHPAPAIDAFLRLVAHEAQVLAKEGQLIVRKTR